MFDYAQYCANMILRGLEPMTEKQWNKSDEGNDIPKVRNSKNASLKEPSLNEYLKSEGK